MLHILNVFRNISYCINAHSSIFLKQSNSITYYYKNNFFLQYNKNIHKIKKQYGFNMFYINILLTNLLDKKNFFNVSCSLFNKYNSLCVKIKDNHSHIQHFKIKKLCLFDKNCIRLKYKKKSTTLNTNQFIKKNYSILYLIYQKNKILNKILLHNFNIKFFNKRLELNKNILSFLYLFLKSLIGSIGSHNVACKNFKISINNYLILLDKQFNRIDISFIKEIFFLKKKEDIKMFFNILDKYHFINLDHQCKIIPKDGNFYFDCLSNLKLNFFYRNKIWRKIMHYEILTKIYNIKYVVDFKLYQECLGFLFLRLKINFRDKIAKFYIFSKSNKIYSVLKSSVSFLKNIFNKNSIKLSEITINNQCFFQNQKHKDKKKYFNQLIFVSNFKKENKRLNSILFFNKIYIKNIISPSNKIDIYA
ncbi:MAG TPA: hypothetical protein VNF93_00060 [Buchnera sp. (in: enterobacteria)]|nr:hypothetical protein [Buchnera sp. (in: enterobacteria)]